MDKTLRRRINNGYLDTRALFTSKNTALTELGIESNEGNDWLRINIRLADITAWRESEPDDETDELIYGKA